MKEIVDKLLDEVAKELNISVLELRERSTVEPILHQYYQWKFNWDPKDETTIPF